jgi:hypothetical protein
MINRMAIAAIACKTIGVQRISTSGDSDCVAGGYARLARSPLKNVPMVAGTRQAFN